MSDRRAALDPGAAIGFVGLGNMGKVMAERLLDAGYRVRGFDTATGALDAFAAHQNASAATSAADTATGTRTVVLMLPDSDAVENVLLDDGLLDALAPGTLAVDMSSSEPGRTRALAARAAERGVGFVDAPVSGGVRGARAGSLSIMAGGDPDDVRRCRPMLDALGNVTHVGGAGSGDALKALNNLMSATHLLVSSEALLAAREFGIDPELALSVVNASTGRSGSTEYKWPSFVLTESYASGFAMRLMVKDMRIALDLCRSVGVPSELGEAAVRLWQRAAQRLPDDADHTEIVRLLDSRRDEANCHA